MQHVLFPKAQGRQAEVAGKSLRGMGRAMSYVIEFELIGSPKPANRLLGSHWRTRSSHATTWKRAVWAQVWNKRPPQPLAKAKLTLTRMSSRECDFDGLVSSFKSIIDGLVQYGVLLNDRSVNIGQPEYKWEKCKPAHGRVRIKVEEAA